MSNLLHKVESFLEEARKSLKPQDPPDPSKAPEGKHLSSGYTMYRCTSARDVWNVVEGDKWVKWTFSGTDKNSQLVFDKLTNGIGVFYVFIRDDYILWFRGKYDRSEIKNYSSSMVAVPFNKGGYVGYSILTRVENYDSKYYEYPEILEKETGVKFSTLNRMREANWVGPYAVNSSGVLLTNTLDNDSYDKIVVPDGVVEIGNEAFKDMHYALNAVLPCSVKVLGTRAFSFCERLSSIHLPEGLRVIGDEAFQCCRELGFIKIPNSVTEIGERAFSSCSTLLRVNLPSGLTELKKRVFQFCDNLQTVEIPDSVKKIGDFAFYRCKSLHKLTIPSGVQELGNILGISYDLQALERECFSDMSLKSISVSKNTRVLHPEVYENVKIHLHYRD